MKIKPLTPFLFRKILWCKKEDHQPREFIKRNFGITDSVLNDVMKYKTWEQYVKAKKIDEIIL